MTNTHIQKAGRAIAEVRKRHQIVPTDAYRGVLGGCSVIDWSAGPAAVGHTGTEAECQQYIDEQMATAAFESVLPVADDLVERFYEVFEKDSAKKHRTPRT